MSNTNFITLQSLVEYTKLPIHEAANDIYVSNDKSSLLIQITTLPDPVNSELLFSFLKKHEDKFVAPVSYALVGTGEKQVPYLMYDIKNTVLFNDKISHFMSIHKNFAFKMFRDTIEILIYIYILNQDFSYFDLQLFFVHGNAVTQTNPKIKFLFFPNIFTKQDQQSNLERKETLNMNDWILSIYNALFFSINMQIINKPNSIDYVSPVSEDLLNDIAVLGIFIEKVKQTSETFNPNSFLTFLDIFNSILQKYSVATIDLKYIFSAFTQEMSLNHYSFNSKVEIFKKIQELSYSPPKPNFIIPNEIIEAKNPYNIVINAIIQQDKNLSEKINNSSQEDILNLFNRISKVVQSGEKKHNNIEISNIISSLTSHDNNNTKNPINLINNNITLHQNNIILDFNCNKNKKTKNKNKQCEQNTFSESSEIHSNNKADSENTIIGKKQEFKLTSKSKQHSTLIEEGLNSVIKNSNIIDKEVVYDNPVPIKSKRGRKKKIVLTESINGIKENNSNSLGLQENDTILNTNFNSPSNTVVFQNPYSSKNDFRVRKKKNELDSKLTFAEEYERRAVKDLYNNFSLNDTIMLDKKIEEMINFVSNPKRKFKHSYSWNKENKAYLEKNKLIKQELQDYKAEFQEDLKNALNEEGHAFMFKHFTSMYGLEQFYLNTHLLKLKREKYSEYLSAKVTPMKEFLDQKEKNKDNTTALPKKISNANEDTEEEKNSSIIVKTKIDIITQDQKQQETCDKTKDIKNIIEGYVPHNYLLKKVWEVNKLSDDTINDVLFYFERKFPITDERKWTQEVILELLKEFNFDTEKLKESVNESIFNSKIATKKSYSTTNEILQLDDNSRRKLSLRSKIYRGNYFNE